MFVVPNANIQSFPVKTVPYKGPETEEKRVKYDKSGRYRMRYKSIVFAGNTWATIVSLFIIVVVN